VRRAGLQSSSTGLPAWKRGQPGQVGNEAALTFATSAGVRLVTLLFTLFVLGGCASLPNNVERSRSIALEAPPDAPLAMVAHEAGIAAGQSGFRPLAQGNFSLDARFELIRRARVSLDLQYYLIGNDGTGRAILRALRDAAQRGVRVRLLVDDLYTEGLDDALLGLAAQRNVEVRLFNPFAYGRAAPALRLWNFVSDFNRLNHRMHNKLFIADGALAIAGGRNLADEYFFRNAQANFIDFDLLLTGTVVRQLSATFDDYWNSEQVFPIQSVADNRLADDERRAAFERLTAGDEVPATPAGHDLLGLSGIGAELDAHRYSFVTADADVYADAPSKVRGIDESQLQNTVTARFISLLREARSEVVLISPYFVPGKQGLAHMREAREHGVTVRVVTNAMAASDEPLVNSGYDRYRTDMLRIGVQLFEMSSARLKHDPRLRSAMGSSAGRLHAKLGFIDRHTLLVGSLNMDPRSARTNTELGIAIRSPELVRQVSTVFYLDEAPGVYEVHLAPDGNSVQWVGRNEDGEERVDSEPEASLWQRLRLFLLSLVVPEDML
jgi:putative cardiolipin synthase